MSCLILSSQERPDSDVETEKASGSSSDSESSEDLDPSIEKSKKVYTICTIATSWDPCFNVILLFILVLFCSSQPRKPAILM